MLVVYDSKCVHSCAAPTETVRLAGTVCFGEESCHVVDAAGRRPGARSRARLVALAPLALAMQRRRTEAPESAGLLSLSCTEYDR